MSKLIKPLAIGALLVGAAFLTGGVSIGPSLSAALAAGAPVAFGAAGGLVVASGFVGTLATGLLIAGGLTALSGVASAVGIGAPKIGASQLSRLTPTLDPRAYRKWVFGETAMALDTRYDEPSGADQEYQDKVVALASHAVESIDEIWFEDRLAWTAAGGVTAYYAGYLTVGVVLEATAANYFTINGGARWGSTCRMIGCAMVRFRIKRTGNSKKAVAPLAQGLPGRVTVIGKGAKVYDPRRDSTRGGSGTHRADDQSTWQYASGGTVLGTNTALQHLFYQLGWRINGKLALGKGLPPARLDIASYIAAANLCDEAIALAGGGTQRRYETHGVFSESDPTSFVNDSLCTSMNAEMTDANGRIGIDVAHDDLSGSLPLATADDILGDWSWDPSVSIHDQQNVLRGQFTDPSRNVLFQLRDYPEVRLPSIDGIERPGQVPLPLIQDGRRAQRLVKQMLQRAQFSGIFGADFGPRALAWKRGTVIRLTLPDRDWVEKLFRVKKQTIVVGSGRVELVLREEHSSIYAWDRDERPIVTVPAPILYNPWNNPLVIAQGTDIGVADGATRNINRGAWVVGAVYAVGDFFSYAGSSYSVTTAHISAGGSPPPNVNVTLLAAAGPPGNDGDDGLDGDDGDDGAPGINSATVSLYQRTSSASPPAVPAGTTTYTFASSTLSGAPIGAWSQSLPTSGGPYRWMTSAPAASTAATDTIAFSEWATPALIAQDGAQGAAGGAAPPPTPIGSGSSPLPTAVFMTAGQSINLQARLTVLSGVSGGNIDTQIQARAVGGSFADVAGGFFSASLGAGSPGSCAGTTSFTNTTGADGLFNFQTVSNTDGRSVNAARSFLNPYF